MSILRASGAARPRAWRKRIGFRRAVPVRRDRHDLRRLFRQAARAALADRQSEMTTLLDRLSADHVPLSDIVPGPWPREGVVEFLDGTRLLLTTRRLSTGMDRLRDEHRGPAPSCGSSGRSRRSRPAGSVCGSPRSAPPSRPRSWPGWDPPRPEPPGVGRPAVTRLAHSESVSKAQNKSQNNNSADSGRALLPSVRGRAHNRHEPAGRPQTPG